MSSGSVIPVLMPVGLGAGVATALAVAVNLATGGGPWWMWLLVVVLTGAGFATSVWLHLRQSSSTIAATGGAHASGLRSVAVHGNPAGPISTGDIGTTASLSSATAAGTTTNPAGAEASAVGERSVAINGNPGAEISTGDRHTPPAP